MRIIRYVLIFLLLPLACLAHEIRPASLHITEFENGGLEFRWRQPIRGEYTISIAPEISSGWLDREPGQRITTENALIHLWEVDHPDQPLAGQTLHIRGLDRTITDVLLTINYAGGNTFTHLIKADDPSIQIPARAAHGAAVPEYLVLGIKHIWSGIDHLTYVFALILLIHGFRMLVSTISAFTLAHSITLACSALGLVHLRLAPVEAVISLSIVYVAVELVNVKRGRPSITSRRPWLIAFSFGLLHGFGFAGALQAIGLPENAVAMALLLFNLGIEIGQLVFVAVMFCGLWILKTYLPQFKTGVQHIAPYLIGVIASFWLIERLLMI